MKQVQRYEFLFNIRLGSADFLRIFAIRGLQNDACGTDGKERSVFYHAPFAVAQYHIVYEGACVAGAVAEDIFQFAVLVARNVDDAVGDVDTWVYGLNRAVYPGVLHVAANHVVAHLQGNHLLVMEYILYHYNDTARRAFHTFVWIFVTLQVAQFRYADAYAKLLATLVALEDQRLAFGILGLIEEDVIIAFGTSYPFHFPFSLVTQQSLNSSLACRRCIIR